MSDNVVEVTFTSSTYWVISDEALQACLDKVAHGEPPSEVRKTLLSESQRELVGGPDEH